MKAQRIVVTEFGTRAFPDPCKTIWGRFMSYFSTEMTDNDNVNIYPVGDQLYASTETNFIRRVDQNSLTTHEKVDLSNYLTMNTGIKTKLNYESCNFFIELFFLIQRQHIHTLTTIKMFIIWARVLVREENIT
jgi:hypothetical protein